MKNTISAVVLVKNAGNDVDRLKKNLDFCDEIIFLDDESSDGSLENLQGDKVRKIKNKLQNFSSQRNLGIKEAKSDWVLFVDSDEELSQDLIEDILKMKNDENYNGFSVVRKDIFLGKKLNFGETGRAVITRMVRKSKGGWERLVHERLVVSGKTKTLKGFVVHHHGRNMASYINSINKYSSLHAVANRKENKQSSLPKIIFYPILKFLYIYIYKLGILDGTHGFVAASNASLHSFLSWSKEYFDEKI